MISELSTRLLESTLHMAVNLDLQKSKSQQVLQNSTDTSCPSIARSVSFWFLEPKAIRTVQNLGIAEIDFSQMSIYIVSIWFKYGRH